MRSLPVAREPTASAAAKPRSASAIDEHIGRRLRLRRQMVGMTLDALADRLELSPQQLMKYERGTNRLPASRLYWLSGILQVHPSWFFDGLELAELRATVAAECLGANDEAEMRALLRLFGSLKTAQQKRTLLQIARAFANELGE